MVKTVDSNYISGRRVARKKLVAGTKTWEDEHMDGTCGCLIGQKRPYVTRDPVAKVQPFSQIKTNINRKICLDCWLETQTFVPGAGTWDWGLGERIKFSLFPSKCYINHSLLFKAAHYLARKIIIYVTYEGPNFTFKYTQVCSYCDSPVPNQVLDVYRSRTFIFTLYQFLYYCLSCSQRIEWKMSVS